MASFIIEVRQEWRQLVYIEEAANREEALAKFFEGNYTIHDDPQYRKDIDESSWKVEELK